MIVATPTLVPPTLVPALAPLENGLATVRQRHGPAGTRGLVPGLVVPEDSGDWQGAYELVQPPVPGRRAALDHLLDAAKQRWRASPHAAAALAWRSYSHWLAMPVVLSWALARRVPLVDPLDVRWRIEGSPQLLTLGLRRVRLAVLPDDPLAGEATAAGPADGRESVALTVVDTEQQLLEVLRHTLREQHLDLLLARLQERVRLGTRTLLGSLAAAVAYALVRGGPQPAAPAVERLLAALDLADLVELRDEPGGPAVQRRTCCLAFTLPEPKICASCCLRA